jgi:branched-chain amino acid transport system ATP-binding protein
MASLLELDRVSAGYGAAIVVEGVSLAIEEGSGLALLGRNGVGKTTLLLTMLGLTRQRGGAVRWRGADIGKEPAHRRARAGIGWVPQERHVFPSLTVEQNLTVTATDGAWTLARVYAVFPRLEERKRNLGSQLSGGEQQMLAIGRALMTNPRLLLLDEPMEGLAPIIVQELTRVVSTLSGDGELTVVIVEQHARLALSLTRDAIVMDRGRIVHRAPSEALLRDPEALQRLLAVA